MSVPLTLVRSFVKSCVIILSVLRKNIGLLLPLQAFLCPVRTISTTGSRERRPKREVMTRILRDLKISRAFSVSKMLQMFEIFTIFGDKSLPCNGVVRRQ